MAKRSESHRVKTFLTNLSFAFFTLVIFFLFLEVVVFRFILAASDVPRNEYIDDVIRLKPDQRGVYRIEDEIKARYKVNDRGWNSGYEHYSRDRSPEKSRIAVIGDSFVEALQVDFNNSLAEKLERRLGQDKYEVYRFGISGAPLSQYLQMLRQEVLAYSPDLVVVVLIHNDFKESYDLMMGRYTRSFLRLDIGPDHIEEIKPQKYERPWYAYVRGTATYRYLVDRQRVDISSIKKLIFSVSSPTDYQANIDTVSLDEKISRDEIAADYIFRAMRDIAEKNGIRLLIVMDGDRGSIYRGIEPDRLYSDGALQLNKMAAKIAEKYDIPFIDMHPVFERDYMKNKIKFNYQSDAHWNDHGHEVVAETIYRYLLKENGN